MFKKIYFYFLLSALLLLIGCTTRSCSTDLSPNTNNNNNSDDSPTLIPSGPQITNSFDGLVSTFINNFSMSNHIQSNVLSTGWNVRAVNSAATANVAVQYINDSGDQSVSLDDDIVATFAYANGGAASYATNKLSLVSVSRHNGSNFSLASVKVEIKEAQLNYSFTNSDIIVTAYKDGSALSGAVKTFSSITRTTWTNLVFSDDSAFNSVDEIQFTFSAPVD